MWLSPQVIVSGWVYKTIVIESFFNMALHNKALINQCLQACWNPFTLSPGRDPWAERWFPSITHHALRISSQSPDPGLLLASPLSCLQWFYYITVSQKDSVGPSEPEMYFLPFIFFKPLSKNSKRGLKKKKKPTTTTRSWSLHPCLLYCLNVIWGDALKMSKMNRLEWVFQSFRDETDSPGGDL